LDDESSSLFSGAGKGGVMARKKTGTTISVRKRAPWKPEKGQYIRPFGTRLAIPERTGFAILALTVVLLIVIAILI
jgi:hypothetical protein